MAIAQFLDSSEFDPETKRVMAVALEMARAALQLGDRSISSMNESPKELSNLQKPANSIPIFCVSLC